MPLYQYKCENCTLELERIVPVKERDAEFFCPKCSTLTTREVSLTSPPQFKGTGWTTPSYNGVYSKQDVENMSANDLENIK